MAWDDTKSTNEAQSDVPADEKITSSEWNQHVTDQKNHASRHESGGSDALTLGNLADMGATAVIIDTAGNRPTAGTADRLFIDTTNGRIEHDDGAAWNVVASIGDTQLTEEEVDDFVADLLAGGDGVTVTYDDAGDTLTIADAAHGNGTATLSTGATPAHDATLGLSLSETDTISDVRVTPDSAGQVAADYAYSVTWWRVWDDSAGAADVHLQVDWQTDPGSDLTIAWEVLE